MTESVDFDATLWRPDAKGASTFITLPFDVKALFGRSRCPVRVTINDHCWRTTTQVHGDAFHIVVNGEARAATGAEPGATVHVRVRKDDTVRTVDVPPELAMALRSNGAAKEAFEAMPASHRREYARWVGEAQQPGTRVRRAAAAVEKLKAGVRRKSA